jgi:hypothetical protein
MTVSCGFSCYFIRGFFNGIILILENIWLNRQLLIECKVRNLTWAMEWKGERLGIVETRPHYTIILKGFIL